MNEYNRLMDEYENLDEEEKKSCLIYKSKLSYLINEIASVPSFLDLSSSQIYELIKNKSEFNQIYMEYKKYWKTLRICLLN